MFRVKIGENEVELSGSRQEVLDTLNSLQDLMGNISKAFASTKPKTIATITVKTAEETKSIKPSELPTQNYPIIETTHNSEQAIIRILESDWGKWRPRTVEELKNALLTNKLEVSEQVLTSALDELTKKGTLRRWSTNTGFVYILSEPKPVKSKGAR